MTRLVAIELQQIGPFTQRNVQFDAGLNLVTGRNEAGKSTLARATLAALLGDLHAENLHRLGHIGEFGAAIRLATDESDWMIDRDFGSHRVRVWQIQNEKPVERFSAKVSPRGRSADINSYHRLLAEIFGLPDAELIAAILGGGRRRLLDADAASLARQILNGHVLHDHQAVREDLLEHYFELTNINPDGRNRPKARLVQNLEGQIDKLKERLVRADQANSLLLHADETYQEAALRMEAIRNELNGMNQDLDVITRLLEIEQHKLDNDEKRFMMQQDKDKLTKFIAKREIVSENIAHFARLEAIDHEGLQTLRKKRGMLLNARQREEKRLELAGQFAKTKPTVLIGTLLVAFLIAATGFFSAWLYPALTLNILAVSSSLLLLPAGLLLRKILRNKTFNQILQARMNDLADDRDQALSEADSLTVGAGFNRLELTELEQVIKQVEQLHVLRNELDRLEAQIAVLPAEDDLFNALLKVNQQAALLELQKKEINELYPQFAIAPEEKLTSVAARVQALETALEKAKKEREEAFEKRALRRAEVENPESLRETLLDLEEEFTTAQREASAIWEAVQVLDESIREYTGDDLLRLAAGAQKYFDRLTSNDSRQVQLDGELMPFLVGTHGNLPIASLSAATVDQLLLSCRLALLDHLSPERPLPLWLDDAAVGYDIERRTRFIEMMETIAQNRQVILLTPDERLDNLLVGRCKHIEL